MCPVCGMLQHILDLIWNKICLVNYFARKLAVALVHFSSNVEKCVTGTVEF
jgi:hypothetical protein